MFNKLISLILAFGTLATADDIQLPDEALSQESVYPVFEDGQAVKDRLIKKTSRLEANLDFGTFLRDPFYSVYPLSVGALYHLNETHAIGVEGAFALTSQKQQATDIQAQTRLSLTNAPQPSYYGFLKYELTPYYGKISVTKDKNYNLDLSVFAGAGYMGLKSEGSVAFTAGINQRFYFSNRFAIKPELRALIYQQNDPVFVTPTKTSIINLMASLGVIFLF